MESDIIVSKIEQDQINNVAWRACDTFRGVVDPSEYKNYILVMLFLKYISDVWKDKLEEYEKTYPDDPKRVTRKMGREAFVIPENCSFNDLYESRKRTNIGELIDKALQAIEEKNIRKLEGVFRNITFNSESALGQTKERNRRLKNLLEDFAVPEMDLRPSRIGNLDVIGNTYEYMIYKFASGAGKKGGEFYTPAEVSMLLAKLLQPEPGDRICDPTFGSGSLLIKVARETRSKDFSLYGQESNGSTWALGKMNMFLHNVENARLEWGDTLNNPKLIENDTLMKFNIVVANPPFSLKKWGAENAADDRFNRFHRGIPPQSKGDYAFLIHMIETIREDTGRVGVIVPHGVLFRGGKEGAIRKKLIDENLLHAVIGLPSNLFFGAGISAAILIFKRTRETRDVLFIDASGEFDKMKKQNVLREEDIEKIVRTYEDYETIDKYAYRAGIKEIRENEYNLNIPRYVDTFEPEEEVDIPKVQEDIERLEGELIEVRARMKEYLKELGF